MLQNPRLKPKRLWRLGLRLLLSGLALWLVSRRIEFGEAFSLMTRLKPGWIFLSVFAFALSHVVSSERSRWLWRAAGADLHPLYAWRLYWLGAFYSLFLPGGVGGDGYKIYILKRYAGVPLAPLVKAGLLDRGYGVAAILWLSLLLALGVLGLPGSIRYAAIAGLFLFFPGIWLGMKLFFPAFLQVFIPATVYSLLKQILQAFSAICILLAMGTPYHQAYPLAFLLSSLALILPISVGGIGARELVLSYFPAEFPISEEAAVAMSLLFFLLSALFSLAGAAARALPVVFRDGRLAGADVEDPTT